MKTCKKGIHVYEDSFRRCPECRKRKRGPGRIEEFKEWKKANKDSYRCKKSNLARSKLKKARIKQAIPKWITKTELREISQFYKDCPVGYHVDHIIPLAGKTVSGLHVISNLQYLQAEENIKKSNKF